MHCYKSFVEHNKDGTTQVVNEQAQALILEDVEPSIDVPYNNETNETNLIETIQAQTSIPEAVEPRIDVPDSNETNKTNHIETIETSVDNEAS